MKIIIYTTASCPYCKMLKDYLNGAGVAYTEKLVDSDEEARLEMMAKSDGYMGVPFTVLTKDSGEEIKIVGFDKKLFETHVVR